jgi:hypothetical protein
MASSPKWKVYSSTGEYIAACKYAEDAARMIAGDDGGTVRYEHKRVAWTEGTDGYAGESYDDAADVMCAAVNAIR